MESWVREDLQRSYLDACAWMRAELTGRDYREVRAEFWRANGLDMPEEVAA